MKICEISWQTPRPIPKAVSASVTTSRDRVAISRFTFEMGDPKHLGHLLNVVRNVEGVYDVYRVTSAA